MSAPSPPATCELVSRVEPQSSLSRAFDWPLNWAFNPAQPQLDHNKLMARLMARDRDERTSERMRSNVKGWRKAAKDGKYAMVDETLDSCDELQGRCQNSFAILVQPA